jgi:hypothetical protein
MLGLRSPLPKSLRRWKSALTLRRVTAARALAAVLIAVALPAFAAAKERTLRLRLTWDAGQTNPQLWQGRITVPGGEFSELLPLGTAADEAAALRLEDDQIVVAPILRRQNDGCDVTIRADERAELVAQLRNAADPSSKPIRVRLSDLEHGPVRNVLDDTGGALTIARAPGDRLRVVLSRDHLVFEPGEKLEFSLEVDLPSEAEGGSTELVGKMLRNGASEPAWNEVRPLNSLRQSVDFRLTAPQEEGAYRLTLTVRKPPSIATRLAPWEAARPLVERSIDLVVIDPQRRLPRWTDDWTQVAEIDPTSTSWRQKLPHWTQRDLLPWFHNPRPLGNVEHAVHTVGQRRYIRLPAATQEGQPAWQAFVLSVDEPGRPHGIEVEVPANLDQSLRLTVVEPDAAGRVERTEYGLEAVGAFPSPGSTGESGGASNPGGVRIQFWPRTRSPVLVVANGRSDAEAIFGRIRLLARGTAEASSVAADSEGRPASRRPVARYLDAESLLVEFGAGGRLDPATGQSVDDWHAALTAFERFVQQTLAEGFDSVIITVAEDGSSWAPIDGLGNSPRLDGGVLDSNGADPLRKDLLEAFMRICDREQLRVFPALRLESPLPALEPLRSSGDPLAAGVATAGVDGRQWLEGDGGESIQGPRYNLLNPQVQAALARLTGSLAKRYADHPSFGGIAVHATGRGYGVLAGRSWHADNQTLKRFATDRSIELPIGQDQRRQELAGQLLGPLAASWSAWRNEQVAAFYGRLAKKVRTSRADAQLVLCTEELFAGRDAAERVRLSLTGRASLGDALSEIGFDPALVAAQPGVVVLRPNRLSAGAALVSQALDLRINGSGDFARQDRPGLFGELGYQAPAELALPSFDAQSPFGPERTRLNVLFESTRESGPAQLLATSLANRDPAIFVEGGEAASLRADARDARLRRIFSQLPAPAAMESSQCVQPVVLRVYREPDAVTILLVNESRWPAEAVLPLEVASTAELIDLPSTAGTQSAGRTNWRVDLPPYGVVARRILSAKAKCGALDVTSGAEARASLAAQVEDIRSRVQNLDVERPFDLLQNGGFELVGADGRMLGWQPRIGSRGAVEVDASRPASGRRCLQLVGEDALGVAAQSHLFPLPETGQLSVRASVRVNDLGEDSRLIVWIEYDDQGLARRRYAVLGGSRELSADWTEVEVTVDDLPLDSRGQMRLQFHLAGSGTACVDDVRLCDLRFPTAQRQDLVKRLLAAQASLDEGQITDCQRLVDGFWPRYLMEFVPPLSETDERLAAKTPASTQSKDDAPDVADKSVEGPRLGERLRDFVPRILR